MLFMYLTVNVFGKKRSLVYLSSKMQEIRDIATMEGIKGKHFFLEADIKGPSLKLDNTGKAILTVSVVAFLPLLLVKSNFFITRIPHEKLTHKSLSC